MTSFFLHRITLCPMENTLVRWIHRIHRTIWLCHNHKARRLHTSLIELNPACHDVIFLDRITLCPMENTLVWWIHRIHRTIWLSRGCHNHQAGRLHTSLIELNPACHDVIFSPSDNSLSDGKHACPMDPSDNLTFTRLPQLPDRPLPHISNWIKACLSWRHFFSIG